MTAYSARSGAVRYPATLVYQDDLVVAFDDISPQAPVHTLVIPREHYADFGDSVPAQTLAAIFTAVPRVAQAKGVDRVRLSGHREQRPATRTRPSGICTSTSWADGPWSTAWSRSSPSSHDDPGASPSRSSSRGHGVG